MDSDSLVSDDNKIQAENSNKVMIIKNQYLFRDDKLSDSEENRKNTKNLNKKYIFDGMIASLGKNRFD